MDKRLQASLGTWRTNLRSISISNHKFAILVPPSSISMENMEEQGCNHHKFLLDLFPAIGEKLPSVILTFLFLAHGELDSNMFEELVMWSNAPESIIHGVDLK